MSFGIGVAARHRFDSAAELQLSEGVFLVYWGYIDFVIFFYWVSFRGRSKAFAEIAELSGGV